MPSYVKATGNAVSTERVFQVRVNGVILHLFGRAQVAELIGLLGQSLVDAEELEGKPIRESWAQRWDHEPVKMECRQVSAPVGLAKRMLSGRPVSRKRLLALEGKK